MLAAGRAAAGRRRARGRRRDHEQHPARGAARRAAAGRPGRDHPHQHRRAAAAPCRSRCSSRSLAGLVGLVNSFRMMRLPDPEPVRRRRGHGARLTRRARSNAMCRWMAWLGQPVLIEELLFKTQHGIVDQSLHSRMGAETTNGDGFGLGWYGAGDGPGVYHSVAPAWADANLRELAAPRRVAAVPRPRPRRDRLARAADQLPPVPPRQLAVRPQRLRRRLARAPARPDARDRPRALRRRQRLDRHRGRLPPRAHPRARGGPDRRARADRRPHRGDRRARHGLSRPRPGHVRHLATARRLWAVRYATEGTARTLFASADVDAIHRLYPDNARLQPPGRTTTG